MLFFQAPGIPSGFTAATIQGFVDVLVVNDDPEYQVGQVPPPLSPILLTPFSSPLHSGKQGSLLKYERCQDFRTNFGMIDIFIVVDA